MSGLLLSGCCCRPRPWHLVRRYSDLNVSAVELRDFEVSGPSVSAYCSGIAPIPGGGEVVLSIQSPEDNVFSSRLARLNEDDAIVWQIDVIEEIALKASATEFVTYDTSMFFRWRSLADGSLLRSVDGECVHTFCYDLIADVDADDALNVGFAGGVIWSHPNPDRSYRASAEEYNANGTHAQATNANGDNSSVHPAPYLPWGDSHAIGMTLMDTGGTDHPCIVYGGVDYASGFGHHPNACSLILCDSGTEIAGKPWEDPTGWGKTTQVVEGRDPDDIFAGYTPAPFGSGPRLGYGTVAGGPTWSVALPYPVINHNQANGFFRDGSGGAVFLSSPSSSFESGRANRYDSSGEVWSLPWDSNPGNPSNPADPRVLVKDNLGRLWMGGQPSRD